MDREEHRERLARRAWALSAMDEEQRRRASQQVMPHHGTYLSESWHILNVMVEDITIHLVLKKLTSSLS